MTKSKLLLVAAILFVVLAVLVLGLALLYRMAFYNTLDGSNGLYTRLWRGYISALVFSIILLICAIALFTIYRKTKNIDIIDLPTPITVIELQGMWEYDGNQRLIIEGDSFKDKYMNYYLSDTTIVSIDDYSDQQGGIHFKLADNMVVEDGKEIATIKDCWIIGDEIHLIKEYVYGERESIFRKTDKEEFYYYDFLTEEYMNQLEGDWYNDNAEIRIKDGYISFYYSGEKIGDEERFVVIKENQTTNKKVFLHNEDMYKSGLGIYAYLRFEDGKIFASPMVMDGNVPEEEFIKK